MIWYNLYKLASVSVYTGHRNMKDILPRLTIVEEKDIQENLTLRTWTRKIGQLYVH